MANLTVPIVVDMEGIKEYLESGNLVEVVRCKDCKHFLDLSDGEEHRTLCLSVGGIFHPKENDFCSKGERWNESET